MRVLPMMVLMALLSGSAFLQGHTRDENWKRCGAGDPDGAIEACSALIQSGQDTGINLAAVFYARGLAHEHKGDDGLAMEDYDQAIHLNASLANGFVARGVAYAHKRDYEHTIQDYDQALRLTPNANDANTFYHRGVAYANNGDYNRAIADYDQALRLDPNLANAYYSLGMAYRHKGDSDRAIQES